MDLKKEKVFQCSKEDCSKSFTLKTNLIRHIKTHKNFTIPKKAKKYVCSKSWCQKEFKTNYNLTRHESMCFRPKGNINKCFICKYVSTKPSNFRRHLETHSTVKKKKKNILKIKVTKPSSSKSDSALFDESDSLPSMVELPTRHIYEDDIDFHYGGDVDCMSNLMENAINEFGCGDNNNEGEDEESNYTHISDKNADREGEKDNESVDAGKEDNVFKETNESAGAGKEDNTSEENEKEEESVNSDQIGMACGEDEENEDDEEESDEEDSEDEGDEEDDDEFRTIMAKSLRKYIRQEIRYARFRVSKKISTAKFIIKIFGKHLENPNFLTWLSDELHFDGLSDFLKYANVKAPVKGRKTKITSELAEKIYNFWKENAIISVDRRNNRNEVKVNPKKVHKLVRTIKDENVSPCKTKRGHDRLKGHRHIFTKTVRLLYKMFVLQNGDDVGRTTFYTLKPFYIVEPTTREMECCTCISCVNPHYVYASFKRNVKRMHEIVLPDSLTEYLTQNFECEKSVVFGYYDIDCINGMCINECKVKLDMNVDDEKEFSYVQFKPTVTTYYNRDGKNVQYSRCARNESRATLTEMQSLLLLGAQDYLIHRCIVSLDKTFWPQFMSDCQSPILHIDYSENIKLTPKNEVQSAHFSGRQHTLHCSVMHKTNNPGDHHFLYHLSDDTIHDSVMTFSIIEQVLLTHPEIIASGTLVIRSDNCSTQYKSRFTFGKMKELAKKYSISFFWFFGAPGHGRGLVDAMSSFGCKGPLKAAIITADEYFENAGEMFNFLNKHFENDPKKSYFVVDDDDNATIRRLEKKSKPEHLIRGSSKLHVVAVNSNGDWLTKILLKTTDEGLMKLHVINDDNSNVEEAYGEIENHEWEDHDSGTSYMEPTHENTVCDVSRQDIKFDFVVEGTFVALPSHAAGFEAFYLVQVVEKGVATTNIEDRHGHAIHAGEKYIRGTYFEKSDENKKHTKYQKSKKFDNVLIHITEIASVNVDFDGTKMSKEEYVAICRDIM